MKSKSKRNIVILFSILLLILVIVVFFNKVNVNKQETVNLDRMQDTEFTDGTEIKIDNLSDIQQQNLYLLGKVWGYAKYRHPSITNGTINWDAELFRVLPEVLNASSTENGNEVIVKWLKKFPIEKLSLSKHEKKKYDEINGKKLSDYNSDWINDSKLISKPLSEILNQLSDVKVVDNGTGYVKYVDDELDFSQDSFGVVMKYDDAGMRLLSLFRYWNIIEYYNPYYTVIGEDWNKILYESIPEFAEGKDHESYVLSVANLISSIHDSHAVIVDKNQTLNNYFGKYLPEVEWINLNGEIVIVSANENYPLKKGDIIVKVNGEPIEERIQKCSKYISVSNIGCSSNAFHHYLLASKEEKGSIEVIRNGEEKSIDIMYTDNHNYNASGGIETEMSKPIEDDFYYINLDGITAKELDKEMEAAVESDGIVLDLRGYTPYAGYILGEYLSDEPKVAFKSVQGNPYKPGSYYLYNKHQYGKGEIERILKDKELTWSDKKFLDEMFNNGLINNLLGKVKERPTYKGKVVGIIDERTQSAMETLTMELSTFDNVTIIGTNTAGANGDVVEVILPGQIYTYFSSLGVYYPNDKQTQRIGLEPDIKIEPTVEGLSNGKDELLERAIELLLH